MIIGYDNTGLTKVVAEIWEHKQVQVQTCAHLKCLYNLIVCTHNYGKCTGPKLDQKVGL